MEHFSEIVFRTLQTYLGPHTARSSLRTYSQRACGKAPEALRKEEAGALLEALRPMLRTLVGQSRTDELIGALLRDLGL